MEERRQIPRWRIDRDARLSLGISENRLDTFVEDMNTKGARFFLSAPLPESRFIGMHLDLEGLMHLEVTAYIAWRKESKARNIYGVFFSRIKDADKDRIYQYLNANCAKQLQASFWAGTNFIGPVS
ncbi:MAG: PilZ domain-containing protein [Candidatus Omnitrophica bacterium]|nr:PilZ domain-containing protein [Candidatus Omnitrophota bacterium]